MICNFYDMIVGRERERIQMHFRENDLCSCPRSSSNQRSFFRAQVLYFIKLKPRGRKICQNDNLHYRPNDCCNSDYSPLQIFHVSNFIDGHKIALLLFNCIALCLHGFSFPFFSLKILYKGIKIWYWFMEWSGVED